MAPAAGGARSAGSERERERESWAPATLRGRRTHTCAHPHTVRADGERLVCERAAPRASCVSVRAGTAGQALEDAPHPGALALSTDADGSDCGH
mgnify:CR=1 FL=1